jgi:hypothetical protein
LVELFNPANKSVFFVYIKMAIMKYPFTYIKLVITHFKQDLYLFTSKQRNSYISLNRCYKFTIFRKYGHEIRRRAKRMSYFENTNSLFTDYPGIILRSVEIEF